MISSSTRKKVPLYYNMTWKSATKYKYRVFFSTSFLTAGNVQRMQNACLQGRVYTEWIHLYEKYRGQE